MSDQASTRYSDEELEEFKALIQEKIQSTDTELAELRDSFNGLHVSDDNERWNMDEGNVTTDADFYAAQISRLEKFRMQLEAAMDRIENKTYGICSVSGQLIDKKRLRAVPVTTQSIEAKLGKH